MHTLILTAALLFAAAPVEKTNERFFFYYSGLKSSTFLIIGSLGLLKSC